MKLFIEKMNTWLLKNYQYGIALLVVSGFVACGFKPITFYPQTTGVVESIREDFYFSPRGGPRGGGGRGGTRVDITVFTINGVEYTVSRNDVYKVLIGKKITYRWAESMSRKHLVEIIYDGNNMIPPSKKDPMRVFIPAFVLFMLGLLWCGWVLVLMWQEWKDYNKS